MTSPGTKEAARSLRVAMDALVGTDESLTPIALGWATVDLDRAADTFTELFGPGNGRVAVLADDVLLGARCRRLATDLADLPAIVLLEPSTEGRLASSLARHGEGPVAVWGTAADLPVHRSLPAPGPFGLEVLLLDGSGTGPYRLLVLPAAGTITP